MAHRYASEALNRLLKDLIKAINPVLEDHLFGDKVVIFESDFHQILSVILKGGYEEIVIDIINSTIINQFLGNPTEYLNADILEDHNKTPNLYPTEFLNSLSITDGLCNGTRLICYSILKHVIDAEIITEKHSGT
ncbi:24475_t:CDS:2, partial [Cetraspora pellucida]